MFRTAHLNHKQSLTFDAGHVDNCEPDVDLVIWRRIEVDVDDTRGRHIGHCGCLSPQSSRQSRMLWRHKFIIGTYTSQTLQC